MPYNYGNYNMVQWSQQQIPQVQQPVQQFQQQIPQVPPVQQPVQQIQQIPQVPPVQQPVNGFVWVQGEMEAKMYPVAAGNSVMLMDSENPVLYMKTRDNTGKYLPMEIYDLILRVPNQQPQQAPQQTQQPSIDFSQYVKRSELEELFEIKVKEAVDKALAS